MNIKLNRATIVSRYQCKALSYKLQNPSLAAAIKPIPSA